jgi:hypothetical protein
MLADARRETRDADSKHELEPRGVSRSHDRDTAEVPYMASCDEVIAPA